MPNVSKEGFVMGLLSNLLDLLFPPRCVFCRSILKTGERGMCESCRKSIERTKNGGEQHGESRVGGGDDRGRGQLSGGDFHIDLPPF